MARETHGKMRCQIDAQGNWNAHVSVAFVPAGVIHASFFLPSQLGGRGAFVTTIGRFC